jgi:hypothetical protein
MEGIALDLRAGAGGVEETQVEMRVVADQDGPGAAGFGHGLAHRLEDAVEGFGFRHCQAQGVVGIHAVDLQRGLFPDVAPGRAAPGRRGWGRRISPSSPISIITAAISSSASVALLEPPVSTSMTTGKKPRKRRASGLFGMETHFREVSRALYQPDTGRPPEAAAESV